ncbi:hypothetical protein C8R42DRAFT_77032 [Lentinula raphanica]|nr:hypothetical protein C8R42DRAFT_77032 [Lentinula raphanica]
MLYLDSLSASIITKPRLLSMMGIILLAIANGAAVRAMDDRHIVPSYGSARHDNDAQGDLEKGVVPYGRRHDDAPRGEHDAYGSPIPEFEVVLTRFFKKNPNFVGPGGTIDVWVSDLDHNFNPTKASTFVLGKYNEPAHCLMYRSDVYSYGPDSGFPFRDAEHNWPISTPPLAIPGPRPSHFVQVAILRAPESVADFKLFQSNICALASYTTSNLDFIVASLRNSWMAYGQSGSGYLFHILRHQEEFRPFTSDTLYVLPPPPSGIQLVFTREWRDLVGRRSSLVPPEHH